jgi:FdhD protein
VNPADAGLAAATGTQPVRVTTWRAGRVETKDDWLAEETPVALVFNGITHAVMLASPLDLEDFALGFGLSEGILESPSELYGVEIAPGPDGIEIQLDVASACEHRLKLRRRQMSGRTGCGLCGTDSLCQVLRPLPTPDASLHISAAAVAVALQSLRAGQAMQRSTGATHAAAWCDAAGNARIVREDVGRHNALDKLIGAMVKSRQVAALGFITLTSRASVEMVQKAVIAGVGIVAAVSAPTSLAVRVAKDHGLALAGFARGDDFVCYSFPERFGLVAAPAHAELETPQ